MNNSKSKYEKAGIDELRKRVKHVYPDLCKLNTYNREELMTLLTKNCKTLGGFMNKNNSCYVDSTLVAIFHSDNGYFQEKILQTKNTRHSKKALSDIVEHVQKRLISIHKSILEGHRGYCTSLRKLFQDFQDKYIEIEPKLEKLDYESDQLEPSDILKLLVKMFHIPDDCKYIFTSIGVNKTHKDVITEEQRTTSILDARIEPTMLYGKRIVDLQKYVPKMETKNKFEAGALWKADNGQLYTKSIIRKKYIQAPVFILHVDRVLGNEKLKTPVIPPSVLRLKNNTRPLYLRSVIVHHGPSPKHGHYTCYIQCKNTWYHYDDLGFSQMMKVGDTEELFKHKQSFVLKNAVDFFYF